MTDNKVCTPCFEKRHRMEKRAAFGRGPVLAAALLLAVWFRLGAALGQEDGAKPAEQAEKGQLKIVGEHIETIVLVDGNGRRLPFSAADMEKPLELAPGMYRPQEIQLPGGYQCMILRGDFGRVDVKPGETAQLKVGGPLTQGITVERQGKMFRLGYDLKGIGGETYTMTNRSSPPEFAVYRGDRKVGGGKFEFG